MLADDTTIHRVLSDALLSARIAAGAPLREVALAEVFGVSRERVRKVLQRLGAERLLELIPNRGAFAAAPTLEQAREIYDARRILEGGIAGHLALSLDRPSAEALHRHLERERAAADAGDRAASIRLSGEFHLMLAQATGNALVQRDLQHLVSRTAMLVALFEPARAMRCACEEHADILAALLAGDPARAMKTMQQHLALIETRLRPAAEAPADDPIDVIRGDWAALQAAARAKRRSAQAGGSSPAASARGTGTRRRARMPARVEARWTTRRAPCRAA